MAEVSIINGYEICDDTARAKTDGHVVTDGTTDYTQRAKLKFINATITDDSTNGQTIVTVDSAPIATTSVAGKVMPDGDSITVDANGEIAANCISTTTTDPGEGSALATGKLLVVLEAE